MSIILVYMPAALLGAAGHYIIAAIKAWRNRPRRIVTTGLPPKPAQPPRWAF